MDNKSNRADIMTAVLNDEPDVSTELDELNCLIYRSPDALLEEAERAAGSENVWSAVNDNVTVHVWETRAKIRIKVARVATTKLSMDRIAEIAVNAISEELKREK